MTRRFALLLGALIFSAAPSFGATGTTWRVDPGHSNAGFTVRHLIVTNVKGTIPIQRATIQTAEGSTLPESIDAILDAAKLNTGNDDRDADLRGRIGSTSPIFRRSRSPAPRSAGRRMLSRSSATSRFTASPRA